MSPQTLLRTTLHWDRTRRARPRRRVSGPPVVVLPDSTSIPFCVLNDLWRITRCSIRPEIKLFGFFAVVLSTMPIAWMYPTSQSLLIGNPLQKGGELLLFVF